MPDQAEFACNEDDFCRLRVGEVFAPEQGQKLCREVTYALGVSAGIRLGLRSCHHGYPRRLNSFSRRGS